MLMGATRVNGGAVGVSRGVVGVSRGAKAKRRTEPWSLQSSAHGGTVLFRSAPVKPAYGRRYLPAFVERAHCSSPSSVFATVSRSD